MSVYQQVFQHLDKNAKALEQALLDMGVETRISVDDCPNNKDDCLGLVVALIAVKVRFTIELWSEGTPFDKDFIEKTKLVFEKIKGIAATATTFDPTELRKMLVADFN